MAFLICKDSGGPWAFGGGGNFRGYMKKCLGLKLGISIVGFIFLLATSIDIELECSIPKTLELV